MNVKIYLLGLFVIVSQSIVLGQDLLTKFSQLESSQVNLIHEINGEQYLICNGYRDTLKVYKWKGQQFVRSHSLDHSYDFSSYAFNDVGRSSDVVLWKSRQVLTTLWPQSGQLLRHYTDFDLFSYELKPIDSNYFLFLKKEAQFTVRMYLFDAEKQTFTMVGLEDFTEIVPCHRGWFNLNNTTKDLQYFDAGSQMPIHVDRLEGKSELAVHRDAVAYFKDDKIKIYQIKDNTFSSIPFNTSSEEVYDLRMDENYVYVHYDEDRFSIIDRTSLDRINLTAQVSWDATSRIVKSNDHLLITTNRDLYTYSLTDAEPLLVSSEVSEFQELGPYSYLLLPTLEVLDVNDNSLRLLHARPYFAEGITTCQANDSTLLIAIYGSESFINEKSYIYRYNTKQESLDVSPTVHSVDRNFSRIRLFEVEDQVYSINGDSLYRIAQNGYEAFANQELLSWSNLESEQLEFFAHDFGNVTWHSIGQEPFSVEGIDLNLEHSLLGETNLLFDRLIRKDSLLYISNLLQNGVRVLHRVNKHTKKVKNMGPINRPILNTVEQGEYLYVNSADRVVILRDKGGRNEIATKNGLPGQLLNYNESVYFTDGEDILNITDPQSPSLANDELEVSARSNLVYLNPNAMLILSHEGAKIVTPDSVLFLDDNPHLVNISNEYFAHSESPKYYLNANTLEKVDLPDSFEGLHLDYIWDRGEVEYLITREFRFSFWRYKLWVNRGSGVRLIETWTQSSIPERYKAVESNGYVLFSLGVEYALMDENDELTWLDIGARQAWEGDLAQSDSVFYFTGFHPTLGDQIYYLPVSSDPNSTNEPIPLTTSPLSIYPNPASTHITISCPVCPTQPTRYEIFSSEGHLQASGTVDGEKIPINSLPAGFYHVRTTFTDKTIATTSFFKSH